MTDPTQLDDLTGLPIGPLVLPLSARLPSSISLFGSSITLERLDGQLHGDSLWETCGTSQRADLWQYMSEGPFENREAFDSSMRQSANQADPFFYAIVDRKTGRALGRCAYLNIRPAHGVVEIGHILFSKNLQRTRGATEALYLMAKNAFDELGYRRYEWKCNALNAKSRLAAERTGFSFEGIFRQHMIIKGRNRDSAWFSILDTEWPHVRRAFESWLAADNFDEQGAQRKSLSDFMKAGLK